MSSVTTITGLVYRYAEFIDTGDFAGAAGLFRHARLKMLDGDYLDHEGIQAFWERVIIRYEDGTPKTKHLILNPIVDIGRSGDKATCRSQYVVIQQVPGQPIGIVAAGRYHDWFERVDDEWRFCERDYSLLDMMGDLSAHVRVDLGGAPPAPPAG